VWAADDNGGRANPARKQAQSRKSDMENSNSYNGFDGATALDANEVKALFTALRAQPGTLATLKHTFEGLKDRLTPSGRAAYQREMSKLLQVATELPQSVPELLDGEYGLVVRGDSEMLATVRSRDGVYTLLLPFDPGLTLTVDVDGTIEGEAPKAKGELRVVDGYLFLELELTWVSGDKAIRRCLSGIGDVRGGRA
jgi:hypothetical protein